MIVEEFVHVVFDEVDHKDMKSSKNCTEEDEQNIILQKLESCPEKQPIDLSKQPVDSSKQLVDSSKQPVEILQQDEFPKESRIPRDLTVENIIGQVKEGVSTRSTISNSAGTQLLSLKLNQRQLKKHLMMRNGWLQCMKS